MPASARLAAESISFLDGLSAEQGNMARLPFDETERHTWAYWPTGRRGVPLNRLDRSQEKAAYRLLSEMLAPPAFARAMAITALEEVLDRVEGRRGDRRHAGDYWVTIFGEPGDDRWGVRFEGHHVSVHATVVGAEVRMTPLFLGANPAVVNDGTHVVLAPLRPEEQLGFELLHALSVEQRSSALIADTAPADILTRNQPRIEASLAHTGVPVAAFDGPVAAVADELLGLYLARIPEGMNRPSTAGARFAWAGAPEPGVGHYYRFAGPGVLIELDNTQNRANHVHTVVRQPGADFGEDLLAAHYQRTHR